MDNKYNFKTKRLLVKSWKLLLNHPAKCRNLAQAVIKIITPKVARSLPDGWQNIDNLDKANQWLSARDSEGECLTIELNDDSSIIGFLFLYESPEPNNNIDLKLGYLLSEYVWGNGIGSELIKGLVDCCGNKPEIKSISGGVEIENVGSIKVLEKNGFKPIQSRHQSTDLIFLERKLNR